MGYTKVRHLGEGIAGWEEAGGPLDRGEGEFVAPGLKLAPAATPSLRARPAPRAGGGSRPSRGGSRGLVARALEGIAGTSFARLLGVWLAIVGGCGILYWLLDAFVGSNLREGASAVPANFGGLLTAMYFSFVTATSIGFGDVVPLGLARVVAVVEGASGLLIFGAIISKLVSKRQEDLVEETHRIAYEARLGRIRTNLHLVLSEMQTMSDDFRGGNLSPERMLPRLESAAMVFVGELRSIHDLLYRPQLVPEEAILEALLANLASGMRALDDILREFPRLRDQSVMLRSGVATISGLANEICGECVPRDYAPELKGWMDQVQELAGRLAADARR